MDNLRQRAQTVHVNEEILLDFLAPTGTRFRQQVRSERVRPSGSKGGLSLSLIHTHDTDRDTSTLPKSYASRRNSVSNNSASWDSIPKQTVVGRDRWAAFTVIVAGMGSKIHSAGRQVRTVERVADIKKSYSTQNLLNLEVRLRLHLVVKDHWIAWP